MTNVQIVLNIFICMIFYFALSGTNHMTPLLKKDYKKITNFSYLAYCIRGLDLAV